MADDKTTSAPAEPTPAPPRGSVERRNLDQHRRLRFRRHRRRAFIRSVYSLPSLATLGNAICGFASIYIAGLVSSPAGARDSIAAWFSDPSHRFIWSAWLIFIAMLFDALDGRLARFARHTTDFGGQLDSLADVISFGAAPAFLALQMFKFHIADQISLPLFVTRLVWAFGAIYLSCAAIRLARFNVSNEHGEQHHFSFLGLPSPGAAGAVAALALIFDSLEADAPRLARVALYALPIVLLSAGLLMVATIRYPHLVNRYLRGKKTVPRLIAMLAVGLLLVVNLKLTLAIGLLAYAYSGLAGHLFRMVRRYRRPDQTSMSGAA